MYRSGQKANVKDTKTESTPARFLHSVGVYSLKPIVKTLKQFQMLTKCRGHYWVGDKNKPRRFRFCNKTHKNVWLRKVC